MGTQIKSPVELAVSTYKKLGLTSIPGVPDFNSGDRRAGAATLLAADRCRMGGGQSWITPGLLLERGNFARDILFPDISFLPPDRYTGGGEVRRVAERIREGMDITTATMDDAKTGDARRIEHERRPRRGVQYPLWQFPRLADGHRKSQADPARYRADQSSHDGSDAEACRTPRRWSTI